MNREPGLPELKWQPPNDVLQFCLVGSVPPDAVVVKIAKAAEIFADNDHVASHGREVVFHGNDRKVRRVVHTHVYLRLWQGDEKSNCYPARRGRSSAGCKVPVPN